MQGNQIWFGNRLWVTASVIGLAMFLMLQVFPVLWRDDGGGKPAISRDAAAKAAMIEAESRFSIPRGQADVELTHMSDSKAIGYFTKTELLRKYNGTWSETYPADVYRADLRMRDGSGTLTLLLQMETGKLLGWKDGLAGAAHSDAGMPASMKDAAERALAYAGSWGVTPGAWEWNGEPADSSGMLTFNSRQSGLGESRLTLSVLVPEAFDAASSTVPPWKNGAVTYDIQVPETFAAYVDQQKRLAGKMNALGFIVPQLTLFILAIGYAASRKDYTTFRRGIGLAVAFAVMYAAFYLNLLPGFRASLLEDGLPADPSAVNGMLVVNFVILGTMALFTYFSAVGGDGLWRSMGKTLWSSWREKSFGKSVMSGMKSGYMLAFLLLGIQSLILVGLDNAIGMFQASDAGQSTYNMTFPWLLLLLAWCAGISEETQSRLFGIGLFRSWLLEGAKQALGGRQPSPRAESALTVLAMFPPGLFWAFGHVGYAVYPAYSRLIELIIMALMFGWLMLRFGFLAVLFAHIVLDSVLMGVQMVFDGLPGNLAAGLIGLALPAIVASVVQLAHRRRFGM